MNPLLRLLDHGQSYWLDNLTRAMVRDGTLERRVREEGLRGVTSNPAIFSKAISGGGEYDEQIEKLAREGRGIREIYEAVVVEDIRGACDVLRPVHDESDGRDGFVSLEVSPYLAHDAEGSIREARRLYRAVDRPNVFIKIPGTEAGVPAIEQLLYEGINVNVTLLFSIESYEAVARAHLRALERRLEEGSSLEDVASVASFFLSRIDVLVDRVLGHRIVPGRTPEAGGRPEELMGRAAVSNARLAYRRFLRLHSGDRWERLSEAGAEPQRMLWASTSTKDPLYSDVRYVEPLIGRHTVNTLPERTIEAFGDHGTVADTVEEGPEEARAVMEGLEEAGVDFDQVTGQLLDEGVQKFIDPYDRLMATLAERRRALVGRRTAEMEIAAGPLGADVDDALESLRERQFVRRLHARDASLWAQGPDDQAAIRRRLGWLDAGRRFRDRLEEIATFAASVREDGIEEVVMLGMGGSVGAARALVGALGSAPGYPVLTVLDDPHPEAVRSVDAATDPATTLYLVASKSGATVETLSLYRHFLERATAGLGEEAAASRFAVITDPGTPLAEEAERRGFRALFLNPENIGGRYSALSLFGLVPAALLGAGPGDLLGEADRARSACDPSLPPADHPGVRLGTVLGMAARSGRDKVTLFVSDRLAGFRPWLDQLLAESLGKDGRGLVPVAGEQPVVPGAYRDDRLFVHVTLEDRETRGVGAAMRELTQGGHPVVRLTLPSRRALAGEFYRWMVATATAGFVLDVNPFDEPDVAAAKRETERLLASWRERGGFPDVEDQVLATGEGLEIRGSEDWLPAGSGGVPERAARAAAPDGYVALLPYFPLDAGRSEVLEAVRRALWSASGAAVTVDRGPAYLHATGQLHKGGPAGGVYLLLTHDPPEDLEVPEADHSFGVLHRAQALADARVLRDRGRRVLRIHLSDPDRGLRRLHEAVGAREKKAAAVVDS